MTGELVKRPAKAETDFDLVLSNLTDGQRRAIIGAKRSHATPSIWVLPMYRDAGSMSRSLQEIGLAGWSRHGAALTKDGKVIRERLVTAAKRAKRGRV